MLTIGTHMSIAGGIAKTAENVVKMEANTMQIFSRNPRGSNYKTYTSEEIEKFQSIRMEHHFGPILAHAPYTMNLASATEKTYEFASMVIREDIQRMDELGIEHLVKFLQHTFQIIYNIISCRKYVTGIQTDSDLFRMLYSITDCFQLLKCHTYLCTFSTHSFQKPYGDWYRCRDSEYYPGAGSGSDCRPEYSCASGNYEWKRYRDRCDI